MLRVILLGLVVLLVGIEPADGTPVAGVQAQNFKRRPTRAKPAPKATKKAKAKQTRRPKRSPVAKKKKKKKKKNSELRRPMP